MGSFSPSQAEFLVQPLPRTRYIFFMTDRLIGFTVVLDRAIREDDAECIKEAIMMVKGVGSVEGVVQGSESFIAESRTKNDITQKLLKFIKEL